MNFGLDPNEHPGAGNRGGGGERATRAVRAAELPCGAAAVRRTGGAIRMQKNANRDSKVWQGATENGP